MSPLEALRELVSGWTPDDLAEVFDMNVDFARQIVEVSHREEIRFVIMEDGDGHSWCVPEGKASEFELCLEANSVYWSCQGTCDEGHGSPPPDPNDFPGVLRFEGRLSFIDPKTD